jgi:hypothetical protein
MVRVPIGDIRQPGEGQPQNGPGEVFARLQATGRPPFCWGRSYWQWGFLLHGSQHLGERDGCETSGVIGHAIRND